MWSCGEPCESERDVLLSQVDNISHSNYVLILCTRYNSTIDSLRREASALPRLKSLTVAVAVTEASMFALSCCSALQTLTVHDATRGAAEGAGEGSYR